jgi:hypothetical protein
MSQSNSLAWEPPQITADVSDRHTFTFDNDPLVLVEVNKGWKTYRYYHIEPLCDALVVPTEQVVCSMQPDDVLANAVREIKYSDSSGRARSRNAWALPEGYLENLLSHIELLVDPEQQSRLEMFREWAQGAAVPLLPTNDDIVPIVVTQELSIRYNYRSHQCFRLAQQTLPYVNIDPICSELQLAKDEHQRIQKNPALVRGYFQVASTDGKARHWRLLRIDVLCDWLRELECRLDSSNRQRGNARRYRKKYIPLVQELFNVVDLPPAMAALPGAPLRVEEAAPEILADLIEQQTSVPPNGEDEISSSELSATALSIDTIREIAQLTDEEDKLRNQQQAWANRLAKVRKRRERLMRGEDE